MSSAISRHSHFLAHSNTVNCLCFGHKSAQVAATGGDDNLLNVWRIREKETKNVLSLSGHQTAVQSVVFDPSERKVVAGSSAGSIKSFDLESGKVSRTLQGHRSTCTTLDYHLYGDYVASGSLDTVVKVWDLRTKGCMQTFNGHSDEITHVCFTPDGRWLTSGGSKGTIRIWDLAAGKMLKEFRDHSGPITCLEFNPEEYILVSSSGDKTIRFWDVQRFEVIGITPTDNTMTTSIAHTLTDPFNGKYMLSSSQDAVRVWSYEHAIECHDMASFHKGQHLEMPDAPAATIITEGMQMLGASLQNAFVSLWMVDLYQLRPFRGVNQNHRQLPQPAIGQISSSPQTQPMVISKACGSESFGAVDQPETNDSKVLVTSDVSLDHCATTTLPPDPAPLKSGGLSMKRNSLSTSTTPETKVDEVVHTASSTMESLSIDGGENAVQATQLTVEAGIKTASTAQFISELRCGMETCTKTFKGRHKCLQELLFLWKKGNIRESVRYLGQLPDGKREAIVVDVLRVVDLTSIGLDLEIAGLLLPLVVELLKSRFETYLSVSLRVAKDLVEAFGPIVRESQSTIHLHSREVDLAAEARTHRCALLRRTLGEMHRAVQKLQESNHYEALNDSIQNLAQCLSVLEIA